MNVVKNAVVFYKFLCQLHGMICLLIAFVHESDQNCFISNDVSFDKGKWICLLKLFADECNATLLYLLQETFSIKTK